MISRLGADTDCNVAASLVLHVGSVFRKRRSLEIESFGPPTHANEILWTPRIAAGDYAIDRTLGIERNTAADFAKSLIDGRLFAQASALRRRYRRGVLLLEGSIDRDRRRFDRGVAVW